MRTLRAAVGARAKFATWALALCTGLVPAFARAAGDPQISWRTLETAHFRVTYHSGLERAAQRVADVSESALATLRDELGHVPSQRVEVVLSDFTDSANGSATALPQNIVRLYMSAPDDLSPLSDFDDWLLDLMMHEYTHTLHLDTIRGLPAVLNAVLGKVWAPHHLQPRWLVEGLAVLEESKHTSAGRMRSSLWNMYLRTDFLENNVATLDQMSHFLRRFPQGNIWYLYGSFFLRWVYETYGEGALRAALRDYAAQPIPWGINRSIRRATGRTYEQLYVAWRAEMQRDYQAQAAILRAQGLRQGVRVTFSGQHAGYPRWIPAQANGGRQHWLGYSRDDGDDRPGFYALPPHSGQGAQRSYRERDRQLWWRLNSLGPVSFTADGGAVLSLSDVYRNVYRYHDLQHYPPGVRDPSGQNGKRQRLSYGQRAQEPSVSPDGRELAFVVNHGGTRYLQSATLSDDGKQLRDVRTVVPSAPYEQVYAPRHSPDGKSLCFSAWSRGGYRDLRLVDLQSGQVRTLFRDRAIDSAPSFSPDGKYVYFHSDRSGIFNLYAYELASDRLWQVSNVLTGAFYPEPSPDGTQLAYVGYSSKGFDLYVMPLNPAEFVPAAEPVARAEQAPHVHTGHARTSRAYNALYTLRPRAYSLSTAPGNFGQAVDLSIAGSDVAGLHEVQANLRIESERPTLQGSLGYAYRRLPFDLGFNLFRSITPRGGYRVGDEDRTVVQESLGLTQYASFYRPGAFYNQSLTASYSLTRQGAQLATARPGLNPYDPPPDFPRGMVGVLGVNYSFSNAETRLRSIGPERGVSLQLQLNASDPALASQYRGLTMVGNLTYYQPLPWLKHHVLALHGGAGLSLGAYPGRGAFFVGGFVDVPLSETIQKQVVQGGFVLRGYEPNSQNGQQYLLANAEYRFPILNLDRGLSTLPIFLNRISGNAFLDYGSAYNDVRAAAFRLGVGLETWFELIVGYNRALNLRLGYARGLSEEGKNQLYFLGVVPY